MAGIINRLRQPQAWTADYPDEKVVRHTLGGGGNGGFVVGGDSALRVSTYYACVNILAQDIGKLPLILYRRLPNGGRERATDHPLYKVLARKPNEFQTSFRWRATAQVHLGLRGNAYAIKVRGRGRVQELLPIHPDKVRVEQLPDWSLKYTIDNKVYGADDVLHIRSPFSIDGFTGVSVATYARESLGLAMATEHHGIDLFTSGALFSGVLQHPGSFKNADTGQKVAQSFDESRRAHRTMVLEEGMQYERLSMTAEDSQFLATRQFQAEDIATRWFRISPHLVGLKVQSSYNSLESEATNHVRNTLLPWLVSWEQELNTALLTEKEQDELYFEFLVDGLLRGDQASRYKAYKDGILTGFMSRNEVRRLENMDPIEGLDDYLVPLNMGDANDTGETDD